MLRDEQNSPERKITFFWCLNLHQKSEQKRILGGKITRRETVSESELRGTIQNEYRLIVDIAHLSKILANLIEKTRKEMNTEKRQQ